jgi:hypothetical protein
MKVNLVVEIVRAMVDGRSKEGQNRGNSYLQVNVEMR